MPDLSVHVGGLTLANPLLAASGCFGYGLDCDPLIAPEIFGAVVTKTVTPEPRRGNTPPRLAETPAGLLNSIGLENVGLAAFLDEKLPALGARGLRPVVSIAAGSPPAFAAMAGALDPAAILALELNLSCPNVAAGGANFATDPAAVAAITRAVRSAFDGPVWVKLTPNVTDIAEVAAAAARAGADAVCAINTLLGMDIDLETGKSPFARVTAGLSGPAVLPVALAAVWRIRQRVDVPVLGIGGAASAADVLKFLAAGADAVQVGTALFGDPGLPRRILAGLEAELDRRGCTSFADLRALWRAAPAG
ncbi:MAG: dihydroorotate dehydrogenase [Candidatus Krumholzibacteriota bacterium]|nr:dihydroorotate dehydrogenase [Candidatus Krumholzibacteriota bacterium]